MPNQKIIYQIEFFSYWHAGSGLSGGTDANLTVIKNQLGLPYIPGRSLKGLLREAADFIHHFQPNKMPEDFIHTVFGLGDDEEKKQTEKAGQCYFGNAELSQYLSEQIKEEQKELLYKTLASTAIDANGLAKDHSLRRMEVCIPLTLFASIENFPADPDNMQRLELCFQWTKRMGSNRTRGLGPCQFSLYQAV